MPIKIKPREFQGLKPSATKRAVSIDTSTLWEDVDGDADIRCGLIEIYGESDTGKSHLGLTAPGPIAYIHTHEKIQGLIEKFAKQGKVIRKCVVGGAYRGSPEEIMEQASIETARAQYAISDAYKWARSIVLDNHLEMWTTIQLSELGSLDFDERSEQDQNRGQLVYARINNIWRSILKEYRTQAENGGNTNLIIIGGLVAEYKAVKNPKTGKKSKQATGEMIRGGHKENYRNLDVIIKTEKTITKSGTIYEGTIEKPWFNGPVRGETLFDEDLTIPQIMSLITGQDVSKWEV